MKSSLYFCLSPTRTSSPHIWKKRPNGKRRNERFVDDILLFQWQWQSRHFIGFSSLPVWSWRCSNTDVDLSTPAAFSSNGGGGGTADVWGRTRPRPDPLICKSPTSVVDLGDYFELNQYSTKQREGGVVCICYQSRQNPLISLGLYLLSEDNIIKT